MTETARKPELREQHAHRALTQAELGEEAARRFGPDPMNWAFICPNCGDIATAKDFPERERVGQECVGRHRGALEGEPGPQGRGQAERGCNWAAYGLLRGPWEVTMPDGQVAYGFALAPAPESAPAPPAESEP